jgi:hypothetical protein
MLDRPPKPNANPTPSAAAAKRQRRERKARYRHRQANGLTCLRIAVPEHDFAGALTRNGRLTPDQALCRSEIERALALIVAEYETAPEVSPR